MVDIPTKKELLDLWEKRQDIFEKHLSERFETYRWSIDAKLISKLGSDGQFHANLDDNPSFKKDIQRIVEQCVSLTLSAFIDTITNPDSEPSTDEEMQYLRRRVERLEGELFKLLPLDFEAPSSDNPYDN